MTETQETIETQAEEKKDIFDRIMSLPVLNIFEPFYKKYKEALMYLFFGGLTFFLSIFLFWFMGDTLCEYIFLSGYDIRRDRRKAGRLASIKVVFSDEYEEDDYTERDAEDLYSEIEKDVKETRSERRTKQ